jgi:hypothetical protein
MMGSKYRVGCSRWSHLTIRRLILNKFLVVSDGKLESVALAVVPTNVNG